MQELLVLECGRRRRRRRGRVEVTAAAAAAAAAEEVEVVERPGCKEGRTLSRVIRLCN